MSSMESTPTTATELTSDCLCNTGARWGDPRLKRLFYVTFIVGAGIGSIATSLAFGFWLV